MKTQSNKYYVVLLLIIMFAAPGIAAYVFYQHPSWLGSTRVNKGTLLNPPVVLKALEGEKKWRIVFWTPDACDSACKNQLETLAKVRLALGRKLYQVDQVLVLGDKAPTLSAEEQSALKEMQFQVIQLSAAEASEHEDLLSETKIFLADPNNYLILSYASLVKPDDVYKDLKLLLNTTEKNG
ncbi:hypothetical protein J2N86_01910 [Legionella lytica]|uniref:Cytochrome oxidase Cu insertion factor, SCO1/SenC/PrrC family n=1 Tax=Legionella lytica TaxID=96232 RepID=A0ABY4Y925_9GAMM|nr:hypothetical protein [Legionella lytica]USQ14111.1 hypothetical protein J2N86_01910 [Legionella lytica]